MNTATSKRELSNEKATRIIEAMGACVAERGVSGATFEHVAAKAGVSRGLLHYYFGSKERLLIEVVRRDSEQRIARLDGPLAAAGSLDAVINVLLSSLQDLIDNDPGLFTLLFDLSTEARRNPDVGSELAELFSSSRAHIAKALADKDTEGVIAMRADPEGVVSFLLAIADGIALQSLSDPERDMSSTFEASIVAARHLLGG